MDARWSRLEKLLVRPSVPKLNSMSGGMLGISSLVGVEQDGVGLMESNTPRRVSGNGLIPAL